ncbi:major facilitator superfamily transporter, possible sugar permease [Campylobacter hyointestinalis subsp. lawsonii CCUG 27631]|nr:major facilitator superfamily transporter, possible sugar permease [Campylobacter hyointestinalis subsp. lawsonii CCUG 27631]
MSGSRRIIISLSALFFGMSFIFIANGLVVSSASLLLTQMGAHRLQIGIVISFFFIGALVCTIVSHKLISKVGHIRAYTIFTAIFALSALLHSISNNLIFWAVLRFVLGFSYYSITIVIESWLNAKSKNATRSRVLSFYEIVFYTSFGIGAMIMSLNLDANEIFLIGTIFIIFGAIPLNLLKIHAPQVPAPIKISFPKIFNIAPLALCTGIISGLCMNGFFSMATLFVLDQGYSAKEAGNLIVVAMVGGFISHALFGKFSDKFGRKYAIILASFITFISSLFFIIIKPNIYMQYFFTFFLGAGIFVLYALAVARANDVVTDKNRYVEVSSAILFSYIIGSLLAPLIIGLLIYYFTHLGFLYFYICASLFLLIFASFQKNVTKPNNAFSVGNSHSMMLSEVLDDNNKQQ